jgi:hypothetical protein
MVAYGRADGREDEVGWQTRQQRLDRMCDGVMAGCYGIGLVDDRVWCIGRIQTVVATS